MTNSVISISSDSSEESVRTSTARVILFGTILTTIPSTAPTVDLPYTSPFICTNLSNSDTPERPPSPDPYEVIVARWRSRVAARSSLPSPHVRQILPAPPRLPRRPTILVLPEQPIPVGRPYRTQPNGVCRTLTAKKRVGPLPTHQLALRYSADCSLSDHFTSNDLSRDSFLDSSSPTTSVPVASLVRGALSPVRADLLPPRKRIRDSDSVTDFEPYIEPDIDPDVQENIDACIVFANDIAARGTDVRVEMETATEEEVESSARGTIETGIDRVTHPFVSNDIVEPVREDFLELVSADGSLEVMQRGLDMVMQDLYDYMMEIPVHRVRVIESV
ncbi:hypothetical protein Tco_1366921 [Tanacetum coccineum]